MNHESVYLNVDDFLNGV